ncbi:hypothetical protein [Streptomyces sp. NPDC057910]|uniref:hypothetical protein n=1 Tax=Streptomyces sp. NPDC057910 TaxID=3346278 RepID=UPI0036E0912A
MQPLTDEEVKLPSTRSDRERLAAIESEAERDVLRTELRLRRRALRRRRPRWSGHSTRRVQHLQHIDAPHMTERNAATHAAPGRCPATSTR